MQTALEKEIRENFKINERLEIIKMTPRVQEIIAILFLIISFRVILS